MTAHKTQPQDPRRFCVVLVGLVGSRWMAPRLLHASLEQAGFDVKTVFFREDFEIPNIWFKRDGDILARFVEPGNLSWRNFWL